MMDQLTTELRVVVADAFIESSVAMPMGVSGLFIQSFEEGQLEPLATMALHYSCLTVEKQSIEQRQRGLNNPVWLAEFALKWHSRNFRQELERRVQRLEAKRAIVLPQWEELRFQLEQWCPGVADLIDSQPSRTKLFSIARTKESPTRSKAVGDRNRIIRKHADLPHRVICHELDAAFPPGRSPATQLPSRWVRDFSIRSFVEAYRNPRCRPRVHRLISGAKH